MARIVESLVVNLTAGALMCATFWPAIRLRRANSSLRCKYRCWRRVGVGVGVALCRYSHLHYPVQYCTRRTYRVSCCTDTWFLPAFFLWRVVYSTPPLRTPPTLVDFRRILLKSLTVSAFCYYINNKGLVLIRTWYLADRPTRYCTWYVVNVFFPYVHTRFERERRTPNL